MTRPRLTLFIAVVVSAGLAYLLFHLFSDTSNNRAIASDQNLAPSTIPTIIPNTGRGASGPNPVSTAENQAERKVFDNEVNLGGWSNYAKDIPRRFLDIRIARGALTPGNELSMAIIKELDITQSEEAAINELLKIIFSEVESQVSSRIDQVEEGVFRIPSDVQYAEAVTRRLRTSFAEVLGNTRGDHLLSSLSLLHHYGAFGGVDVQISFRDQNIGDSVNPSYSMKAEYLMTSPTTGKVVASGGASFKEINDMFGNAFAIEGNLN